MQEVEDEDEEDYNHNSNSKKDVDQLEQALDKIKYHIISYGFPDPGNIRSSKRKDTRQRLKTFAAMLKQRQKDMQVIDGFTGKMTRLQ